MSQRDQRFLRAAVAWNEGKDFLRDPVDGSERVLHGPNQAQDLPRILFEVVHLETWCSSVGEPVETLVLSFRLTSDWSIVVKILQNSCFKQSVAHPGGLTDTPSIETGVMQLLFGGI